MKKTDLLWILAYPLYQLVGTLRHEASHALMALSLGGEITQFVFWPSQGYWGYVAFRGVPSTGPGANLIDAAPYLVDALTFLVFFTICMLVRFRWRWLWINLIAIGIVSPLVNSAYNYWVGVRTSHHDVGDLLAQIPPMLVHTYFWVTLMAYLIGLILVFTSSRMARVTRIKQE
ncbi:MAG: hypothetical protein PVG63_07095 [Anaerolineales bacterium]